MPRLPYRLAVLGSVNRASTPRTSVELMDSTPLEQVTGLGDLRIAIRLALIASASACTEAAPARIEGPADTIVVNSSEWTPIGIQVLDRRGVRIARPSVTYHAAPESLFRVSTAGAVGCMQDGTGAITIRAGTVDRRFPIRCELVHSFGPTAVVELIAGGSPAPLVLQAYDAHGQPMARARLQLRISDTTVIALRDGMIHGLKPGAAGISAWSRGQSGGAAVWVKPRPLPRDSTTGTSVCAPSSAGDVTPCDVAVSADSVQSGERMPSP